MGEIEADSYNRILARASKAGSRLFRNNTGMGWVGKLLKRTRDAVTLQHPRPLHAGLCNGSSDLIGWTPVVVTPEMVGKTVAVFTAVEVKLHPRSKREPEQEAFIAAVNRFGGIGFFTYTDAEETAQRIANAVKTIKE